VCVELIEQADALTVTVSDDGPVRTAWTPGVGLTGIRERAEELGGTFSAGSTAHGGRIHATYPLGARP
jgi:two-component system, NarL family, sensor kinase